MDGKETMTTFEHDNAVVFCDAFGGKLQARFFHGNWTTVTKTADCDQLDAAERKTLHDACIRAEMSATMRTATLLWINNEKAVQQDQSPQQLPSLTAWLKGDWTEMLRSNF